MDNFGVKIVSLITFLNLSAFSAAAYHSENNNSGTAVSIPSYADPSEFLLYLALPGILSFLAVQQPIEKKLGNKWRRNEPARKYSSIIAGIVVLTALISPVFHSFPNLGNAAYFSFLGLLILVSLSSNKWDLIKEKLPV